MYDKIYLIDMQRIVVFSVMSYFLMFIFIHIANLFTDCDYFRQRISAVIDRLRLSLYFGLILVLTLVPSFFKLFFAILFCYTDRYLF